MTQADNQKRLERREKVRDEIKIRLKSSPSLIEDDEP